MGANLGLAALKASAAAAGGTGTFISPKTNTRGKS